MEDDIAEIGAITDKVVVEVNIEYAVDRSDNIDKAYYDKAFLELILVLGVLQAH